ADEVDGGAGGVDKLRDGVGAGEVERAHGIRGGQLGGGVVAGRAPDEEVALRRDDTGPDGVQGAAVVGGGTLVDGPAAQVDVAVGRVVQLDEVMGVDGTGVAATSVHLVDDDLGGVGSGGGGGGDEDERETGGGGCGQSCCGTEHGGPLGMRTDG